MSELDNINWKKKSIRFLYFLKKLKTQVFRAIGASILGLVVVGGPTEPNHTAIYIKILKVALGFGLFWLGQPTL